jgi:hypothetical protein
VDMIRDFKEAKGIREKLFCIFGDPRDVGGVP